MKSTFDEYLQAAPADKAAAINHVKNLGKQVVPVAEEGMSYGMPALLYKGKGFLSCMVTKAGLSFYPYSGKVVETLGEKLKEFECTTGSIHFTVEHQIPDEIIIEAIKLKIAEIDERAKK
jgi:uncharacterized protein YdhG (YjbR/CyaY superfamily)